jgi:hypothetical protein
VPPRRPCRAVPHCLEPWAICPLRACHHRNASRIFVPRRTPPSRPVVRSRPCAHAKRGGRRTAALKPASRRCALPIKAAHRPARARPQHAPAVLPCAPFRGAPSGRFAAVQYLLAAPHGPYNLPVLPVLLSRLETRRSRGRRGRARGAPPDGQLPALPYPSPATNRQRVSPSSSPTPSSAKGATGGAQFRWAAPPSIPRDYIASPSFFSGCFSWTRDLFTIETGIPGTQVQKWISNSIAVLQNLVNYVENRRKYRKKNLNFFGFVVKNPTTFVVLAWASSL